MNSYLPLVVSVLALGVSALTAWLTLLRRGTVRMTQPTVVFLGPDSSSARGRSAKVFLRALLFSTGKRGNVVENMFARVRRGETSQNFNVWVYGERDDLARGSGLHVGNEGIVCNHHFLLPPDGTEYIFRSGEYVLEVFATLLGRRTASRLCSARLTISEKAAAAMDSDADAGVYFDWGPDSRDCVFRPSRAARPVDHAQPLRDRAQMFHASWSERSDAG